MLLYGHWWLWIPNPQHLCHNFVHDIDSDGIFHVKKLLMLTTKNTHLCHWSFVRGTHWPREDFHPELAIMRKPFPCHDVMVVWFEYSISWRRHQMETFSALLAICAGNSPVTGEFPAQRPVTRSFDIFFDLCLNKRLSKQSWGWWFETSSRSLWRQSNVINLLPGHLPPPRGEPTLALLTAGLWAPLATSGRSAPVGRIFKISTLVVFNLF